jgi:hypothetical protein
MSVFGTRIMHRRREVLMYHKEQRAFCARGQRRHTSHRAITCCNGWSHRGRHAELMEHEPNGGRKRCDVGVANRQREKPALGGVWRGDLTSRKFPQKPEGRKWTTQFKCPEGIQPYSHLFLCSTVGCNVCICLLVVY